jgi:molybdopterin synthase catalytic subunit
MPELTVLFFATFKEKTGQTKVSFSMPAGATAHDLKTELVKKFPGLQAHASSMLVSVNQQFAFEDDILPDGAEVALFPPVSGGSEQTPTILKVVYEPLDLDELVQSITLPSTGAACLFTGMVRGTTSRGDAHETVMLEYEAYIPMAEAKMGQVAEEIRQRWPVIQGIAIVQRIGKLMPETPTVLIACTAAHRDTGVFEAARYGIDRLKEIVPIWKKEIMPGGEEWVEGKYHPQKGD